MGYLLRGTSTPPRAAVWDAFRARAAAEGHTIVWVLWQLIARYVEHGI